MFSEQKPKTGKKKPGAFKSRQSDSGATDGARGNGNAALVRVVVERRACEKVDEKNTRADNLLKCVIAFGFAFIYFVFCPLPENMTARP